MMVRSIIVLLHFRKLFVCHEIVVMQVPFVSFISFMNI